MDDNVKAFTIRLPMPLYEQVSARAKLNRRRLNAEITVLVEKAIDDGVRGDLQVLNSLEG